MILLIPILLLLILLVLLFGAAKVKASILRNLQLMAAFGVLAVLWTTARSLPREFWWFVAGVVAIAAVLATLKIIQVVKRERAEFREMYASNGLSPEEVERCMSLPSSEQVKYQQKIMRRNNDADTRLRMADYGMTDAEIDQYIALHHAGKADEASALHLAAMQRQHAKPEPRRLNIHGY